MAYYNNGFPVNYQPYYQAPNYQQNTQQQMQGNGIVWVSGEAGAKAYLVAPNTSVALWDSEANVIYIKSADMSGMPSIKVLDYTMRDVTPRTAEISPQMDFATKDDVESLKGEISALESKFERMSNGGDKRKEKNDGK